jgi:hypothetical protein
MENNFQFVNKINNKWDKIFKFTINFLITNKYNKNIINIVKIIYSSKIIIWAIFCFCCWFFSSQILKLIYWFMLFDSIIISLLILQNCSIKYNARRLSKNVILLALSSFGFIGGIISLIMIVFIYSEYSKFINRIIFKFLKFIMKICGNIFPPLYAIYPDINLLGFDNPDMTVKSDEQNLDDSNNLDNSDNFNNLNKFTNTFIGEYSDSTPSYYDKKYIKKNFNKR